MEWHATDREMWKFSAVRYRGSYSSVRGAVSLSDLSADVSEERSALIFSVKQSYEISPCEDGMCVM